MGRAHFHLLASFPVYTRSSFLNPRFLHIYMRILSSHLHENRTLSVRFTIACRCSARVASNVTFEFYYY